MSFPEESLNLSVSEGGGYYPAAIHQHLNNGKYRIIRKLGYGPRSSTWLAFRVHDPAYFAVKIFTVAASDRAKTVELPIVKAVNKLHPGLGFPVFHGSFWEESGAGSHICFVSSPFTASTQTLQGEAESHRLPVHAVQKIARSVADALEGLHATGIMHGAITADNIYFSSSTQVEFLRPILDSEPGPTTVKVKKYATVLSQPLPHIFKWNDDKQVVADWSIRLANFGHAQRGVYTPEKSVNYLWAPETLLQQATCSPATDIWMLGYTTFKLLTGYPPFHLKGNVSKQMATVHAALQDELPKEWLSDVKMKTYDPDAHGLVTSIDGGLASALNEDDIASAAAFVKACLRVDPTRRLTAEQCAGHEWLSKANACSCGFC